MSARQLGRRKGLTIVEVMVAITVLAVAALGASAYRYYSTLDVRRADMRTTAARIGLLLCESWRGTGGDTSYDPTAHLGTDLTITPISLPSEFQYTGFTSLGAYQFDTDNISYYAFLSWKDVSAGLRALNVVVAWAQRDTGPATLGGADKTYALTTYATY
jgi:prepilin-type N-terminal cleavage/methylation domain-containing protein